jgi:glutamine synthetase
MKLAEYIWLDGACPTQQLRSKTRVVNVSANAAAADFPQWSFDGSSTNQADGNDSDCLLEPVCVVRDPLRGGDNFLVMCEVLNADGTPHVSNARAKLSAVLEAGGSSTDPWFGFEQEYTLFSNSRPLGWPESGYPGAQGPYYCGVGVEQVFGRDIVEEHAAACLEAGLVYYGLNAEVMPGQWEFQIGYRGVESDDPSAINICDNMHIARWLLHRIAEEHGAHVSFDNKPIKGDWNGAGMHTNFSTTATRNQDSGMAAIDLAVAALSKKHDQHIAAYGDLLHERLTGEHETADISTFKSGVADRGSSIRIPTPVAQNGCGYLEDRRPGANACPYVVAARIIATVADIDDSVLQVAS